MEWRWLVSFTTRLFYPTGNNTSYLGNNAKHDFTISDTLAQNGTWNFRIH